MYKVTVRRGSETLFNTGHNGTPDEYLQTCCSKNAPPNGESVYGSWKKMDLWTYELIPHDALNFPVPKTLVFFVKTGKE